MPYQSQAHYTEPHYSEPGALSEQYYSVPETKEAMLSAVAAVSGSHYELPTPHQHGYVSTYVSKEDWEDIKG